MSLVVVGRETVNLLAPAGLDARTSSEIENRFQAKLSLALAVIEDELRHEFGDISIERE